MKHLSPEAEKVVWSCIAVFVCAFVLIWQLPNLKKANIPSPAVTPTSLQYPGDIPTPPSNTVYATEEPSFSPLPPPQIISGVSWLGKPQKLGNLGLMVFPSPLPPESGTPEYYLLGAIDGQQLIMQTGWDCGIGGCDTYFFRKDGTRFAYLEQESASRFGQVSNFAEFGYAHGWASNVFADPLSKYVGLDAQNFTYWGLQFTTYGDIEAMEQKDLLYTDKASIRALGDTEQGTLFVRETRAENSLLTYNDFFLKLPPGYYVNTRPKYYFKRDDQSLDVTFLDGSTSSDAYPGALVRGCGGFGDAVLTIAPATSRVRAAATTKQGEQLYEFVNPNDPVLKFYYEQMSDTDADGLKEYYIWDSTTGKSSVFEISLAQFATKHPVLLYHDPLGRWVVLSNSTYGPQAECGKPVIYLYPTKTTPVKVQVGAKINVSEPAYGNGWSVIAEPSGRLTDASGAHYDSLFWEGLGNGRYPDISRGFIVKREDLDSTLRLQLHQLGLNDKESADFMQFWLPKMPTTPYTRLSWLTTSEMNTLAPLAVSPRPDTIIRIFLDFEGLSKPENMTPQELTSIPRKGFTLIEWGGLLRK